MADGDTFTDLGTKFKIASGKPASEDQTGYAALTWVQVLGIVSIGQRGDTVADITEPTLEDERNEHNKGLRDGGLVPITIKHKENDAGQADMLEAEADATGTYSFQEVDKDGTAHFYYGRVMEMPRREATTDSNKGYIAQIGVNSKRITGTEVN